MYTITKRFTFEAAHQLPQMPEGHQCNRRHGHSYVVIVELSADELDAGTGFITDFGELADIKADIDDTLDHRDLNDVMGSGEATTAERLAAHLYYRWHFMHPELTAVTICETAKTSATFRPGPRLLTPDDVRRVVVQLWRTGR